MHGVCFCMSPSRYEVVRCSRSVLGVFPGPVSFSWLSCGPGRVPFWLCEFCSLCVSFAYGPSREPETPTNCAVLAGVARSVDEWDSPIIFQILCRHKLRRAAQVSIHVWMKDLSESLIGENCFLVKRVSPDSGGIQPARVLGGTTTSGIGLYGAQQEAFAQEAREAGSDTTCADAALVPRQARGEQVARDPGPQHAKVGECVSCHAAVANRGLSLEEGVLAKASAVRPRATPRP